MSSLFSFLILFFSLPVLSTPDLLARMQWQDWRRQQQRGTPNTPHPRRLLSPGRGGRVMERTLIVTIFSGLFTQRADPVVWSCMRTQEDKTLGETHSFSQRDKAKESLETERKRNPRRENGEGKFLNLCIKRHKFQVHPRLHILRKKFKKTCQRSWPGIKMSIS